MHAACGRFDAGGALRLPKKGGAAACWLRRRLPHVLHMLPGLQWSACAASSAASRAPDHPASQPALTGLAPACLTVCPCPAAAGGWVNMEGMQISDASCVNVKHSNSISSLHFALRYSTLFKGGFDHEFIDDRCGAVAGGDTRWQHWQGGGRGGGGGGRHSYTNAAAAAAGAGGSSRHTGGQAPAEPAVGPLPMPHSIRQREGS